MFLEYFLCKLTFSFIQINTSNIKFEVRISSGFNIFHSYALTLKSMFWGISNNYEKSNSKPNFATYKCMSLASHTYNAVKISMQTAVFYNKICNFISINHTFCQYWNSLSLTKCIVLLIYIYFANKILFCQTLIWGLKYKKKSV